MSAGHRSDAWDLTRDVLDALSPGVALIDASGALVHVNPAGRQMLGIGPEDLERVEAREFFRADGVTPFPASERPSRRVLRGEVDAIDEELVVHDPATGARVTLAVCVRRISRATGESWVVATFTDISRQREAERRPVELNEQLARALTEEHAQLDQVRDESRLARAREARRAAALEELRRGLEAVLEAAPVALVRASRGGVISYVNRAAERLFGYPRADLLGQPIEVLLPDALRDGHRSLREGFWRSPSARAMGARQELSARRRDGSEVPVEVGLSPLELDGLSVVAAVTDLTLRREAQAELRRTNEELRQFVYVATHDLQEPLRMVSSFGRLLAEELAGDGDPALVARFSARMVGGATRAQNLLEDLLAYSRAGRGAIEPQRVDLDEVLAAVREDLAEQIERQRASLEVSALPTLEGNPTQLRRLFQNLVSNGLKYTAAGQPAHVEVSAARVNGALWCISVRDHGIGIATAHQAQIFEVFKRLHAQNEYPGTGIGLAICRKIAEAHGGGVTVESVLGEGATFRVTLPESQASASTP